MSAKLVRRSWLTREWDVEVAGEHHRVKYNGTGVGFEEVLLDGLRACVVRTRHWFAPRFEFVVAGAPALVEVDITPALRVKRARLVIADRIVWDEDAKPWAPRQYSPEAVLTTLMGGPGLLLILIVLVDSAQRSFAGIVVGSTALLVASISGVLWWQRGKRTAGGSEQSLTGRPPPAPP